MALTSSCARCSVGFLASIQGQAVAARACPGCCETATATLMSAVNTAAAKGRDPCIGGADGTDADAYPRRLAQARRLAGLGVPGVDVRTHDLIRVEVVHDADLQPDRLVVVLVHAMLVVKAEHALVVDGN